ncbi:aryl hydrocarbon receptor nuclear translocator-like protein 2 isoform X2 [Folsomia candida]|uniref:Aryl hydrocarbon receptor nuclear translocator-like protein 1 n=1 Tax=Folsomia candida TaxID=158441 RepID=A0A226DMG7_FOLCA|nr:aryl hydrocarbon receptor nuclear translocator-like protein 2 isoform X2 [Folsomia candida]OXA45801.1 Aryl hydrocarbon receptor nuclear translocator-like protein 1 [Folsomia candida]
MELEQQFYLDFPYNAEFDHLPPSSSRLMRNLAEKMRRDKLNMYISELSSLVPIVAMATKRMDKTSVLRLSANFLRIHLSLKQSKKEKPKLAPEGLESNLSTTLLEAIEGFMLIVTSLGKVVYISDTVEKLLGHSQLDLMGQSLYTICHNGDHELLRHHLQPSSPFEAKEPERDASESADYVPRSPSFFGGRPEDTLTGLASGERRSFYVRLAERSMARGDPARHVTVHLIGYLRPPNNKKDAAKIAKAKKECSSTTSSSGVDEYLLVCVARPFRNKGITELSLMEAVQDEYVTRHLPDGRIIYSDHRIAFVAGYLTEEVMGLSAFNFIHQDDLPWATVANRQMFSSVEGQGYSVYRLRSKTGALIYLRTRGFLEFNKTTQKVETFVCINTLLTTDEGDKELEKERERITPFITFQQVTTTTSTNMSSSANSGTPALLSSQHLQSSSSSSASASSSSSLNALTTSTNAESNVPITTKTITTLTMRHRKEKPLTVVNKPPPSSTVTSSSLLSRIDFGSDFSIDEMTPLDEDDDPTDMKPLLLPPLELSSSSSHPPSDLHLNGDTLKELACCPSPGGSLLSSSDDKSTLLLLPETAGPSSSSSSSTTTLSLNDLDLTQSFADQQHNGQSIILTSQMSSSLSSSSSSSSPPPPTSTTTSMTTLMSPTGNLGRLKRSFAEVDDLVSQRTTSAKRPIVPAAFISTYTPIHHSSHLGTKWGSETTTTIIFDQHNNNG